MRVKQHQPDNLDLQQLTDTIVSPGWALIVKRVEQAIDAKRNQLEVPATHEDIRHLQGVIAGLRCALAIPAHLRTEIQARTRNDAARR